MVSHLPIIRLYRPDGTTSTTIGNRVTHIARRPLMVVTDPMPEFETSCTLRPGETCEHGFRAAYVTE